MSRRPLISLAASVIVGFACIATISTDAFAYRRGAGVGRAGVYHGGVYRGGVYRGAAVRRGVAVGVGAAAVGLLLQEHITRHAADTIPTHRATRALVAVIERSVSAASITAAVPVGCVAGSNAPGLRGRTDKAVDPTRSLNITVTCRRSAELAGEPATAMPAGN
jgi:hypothetical protein